MCHHVSLGPLAALALLGRDEARGHVGLAVDRVGVEQVAAGLLDVDEDRVVLGRPAVARLAAVVVGPDQLVEEALAAEQLVEQQLAVVRLAVVDVEVQRALGREQPAHLAQARLEEAEVVVERVAVGGLLQQPRRVAAAAEAGPVAVGVGDRRERPPRLRPPGVERRVEVGHRDRRRRARRAAAAGCRRAGSGSPPRGYAPTRRLAWSGRDRARRAPHHHPPARRAVRLRAARRAGRGRLDRARAVRAPAARRRGRRARRRARRCRRRSS